MVLLDNPLCSIEDVREETKNKDPLAVDAFNAAINAASRHIEWKTGRDWAFHDHSTTPKKLYRGSNWIVDDTIYLPWPILTLTQVTRYGVVMVEDTDFFLPENRDSTRTKITMCGGVKWAPGFPPSDGITLTGTFGFGVADQADRVPQAMPADIRHAATLIAAAFSGHNSKDIVALDGMKTTINDKNIPKAARDILDRYRPIAL